MLGTRGIWEKGWKAVAVHGPTSGIGHFDEDAVAALPHRRGPLRGARPRRASTRTSSSSSIDVWFEEADKYDVLPLDDRLAVEILADPRPQPEPDRDTYVYYPDTAEVPESVAVNTRGALVQDPRRGRARRAPTPRA